MHTLHFFRCIRDAAEFQGSVWHVFTLYVLSFGPQVYEKRPEPQADLIDNGRAYIIILIPRGKAALEEVRADLRSSAKGSSMLTAG